MPFSKHEPIQRERQEDVRVATTASGKLQNQGAGGSEAAILSKIAFICSPTGPIEAAIATAINPAISPYSIAVTPSRSFRNFVVKFLMAALGITGDFYSFNIDGTAVSDAIDVSLSTPLHGSWPCFRSAFPSLQTLFVVLDPVLVVGLRLLHEFTKRASFITWLLRIINLAKHDYNIVADALTFHDGVTAFRRD